MSDSRPFSPQRLLLGAGLLASSVASAGLAWLHAASLGGATVLCGSAQAHCAACYAAPLFAALAVAALAAPEPRPAAAARP